MSTLIVLVHAAFVVFVAAGALLVWRWPRVAWLHLPAVVWAAWIELSGGVCPLTPLEQEWRRREGREAYEGDFIANWIFPWLYPDGLTRETQIALGVLALVLNAALYGWRFARRPRTSNRARHTADAGEAVGRAEVVARDGIEPPTP